MQLVWVSGGGARVTIGRRRIDATAALIPSRLAHAFTATGERLALLLVDGHGARGVALDARAKELVGVDLAPTLDGITLPADLRSTEEATAWASDVFRALGVETSGVEGPSRATRRAISYIEESLDGVPRITEAAARAGISPTRLSHRFSSEIGLPFRRFVLWTRVKRAVAITREGGDLTTAAIGAGFSDAAHLSRTFRAMFGLSPSEVLPFVEPIGAPWPKPRLPR